MTDASTDQYFEDSTNWPPTIELISNLTQKDVLGEERTLRSGISGVLLRIEDGDAVVDFGRFGVHIVDPVKTNFQESYEAIKSGEQSKLFPNILLQIGNKLIQYPERDATHLLIEDIKNTKFLLCFYVNQITEDNALIVQSLDRLYANGDLSQGETLPVLFLGADHWYGYFQTAFNDLPVLIPHMRLSYAAALHQEQARTPSFVLIDVNGKVIYRSETVTLEQSPSRRLVGFRSSKRHALANLRGELDKAFSLID